MTAVLVLVLAACSTAGGDTTTTDPLAEPSTTSTPRSILTTTTTEPTSTTVKEECTERDGVLRNRRGFVCPPYLLAWPSGEDFTPFPATHLPGTYETRAFAAPFSFAAPMQFRSNGDSHSLVQLFQGPDADDQSFAPRSAIRVWTDDAAAQIVLIPEGMWPTGGTQAIEDVTTSEAIVGGQPGTRTDLTCTGDPGCYPGDVQDVRIRYRSGQRVSIININTPNGRVVFEIAIDGDKTDEFWNEVVQPILESIEFLEP